MGFPVTPPVPDYVPDFRPTHVVPRDGLPAWEAPDPGLATVPLDPFLPVELVQRIGDWGQVLCSNGWSAWVDARLLVSVPVDPPEARQPLARTADPRPLIARAEESLGRFRRAAEELAAGRTDRDTFRRRTFGLRVGMVVDGESLWLYDGEHERWVYCDGTGLSTYGVTSGPSAAAAVPAGGTTGPGHGSTRVVPRLDEDEPAAVGGEGGTAAPGHEPTQVVSRRDQDEPSAAGREAETSGPGYEPTRVVSRLDGEEPSAAGREAETSGPGYEPTRVVSRLDGEEPSAAGREGGTAAPGHEPTRVVSRLDEDEPSAAGREGEEDGRRSEPAGPPPTRIVDVTHLPGEG